MQLENFNLKEGLHLNNCQIRCREGSFQYKNCERKHFKLIFQAETAAKKRTDKYIKKFGNALLGMRLYDGPCCAAFIWEYPKRDVTTLALHCRKH